MDSIHLSGAEDVRRAANTMSHAAEGMKSAANTIAEAIDRQRDFMDQWMMRLEAAVEKLPIEQRITVDREPTGAETGL